ncbi:hypothetical protein PtB15_8B761 [Puccinia triticina]|nr:hypothetical protein PtB15_8B761 [Puccinia triticina]
MPQDDNRTTRTTESSSADSWSTWLSIQPPATEPTPHYLTQLGAWAYSWLPAQPQLGTVERTAIIPQNPISDSIPANSKGWTAYFSSRRALPIHKLKEHPPSIEAMKTSLKNKGQHKLPNLQTFELVQALIFSAPPEFPQTVAADALPSRRESSRQRRQAADILHHNQHISTRLPKALDLLGVDRPARIRKLNRLAVIAIHGWFPGPWLESVLGKPTGTSAKFASMMDHALRIYLRQQTGEGKVDDRVRLLFNQLISRQHWLEAVQNADAIFVVSHSQGCLVSCKLIEKLIATFGLRGDRFLSLAMCGIWNGPYVGLNNNYALQPVLKFLEGPAAHELFEFQDPHSPASKAVSQSLSNCLKHGVKHLLIGSMNDQVVPLYSALNSPVDHPSILRALFIDSAVFYATDFLTNLVVFCLRLRNAGFSDHGLIFLLSDYLVGSLNGVGHSTLYEDPHVFELAVRYFFESSSPLDPPTNVPAQPGGKTRRTGSSAEEDGGGRDELPGGLMVVDQSLSPKDKPNPFLLTWSLRGLIEDPRIRLMFAAELRFLKASFLHWTPAATTVPSSSSSTPSPSSPENTPQPPPQSAHSNSKILKDLKVKLEPFKEVQLD